MTAQGIVLNLSQIRAQWASSMQLSGIKWGNKLSEKFSPSVYCLKLQKDEHDTDKHMERYLCIITSN